MNMEFNSLGNLLPASHHLVATQYVEDYSDGDGKFFKFKGGRFYLVPVDNKATAIGVVLKMLASKGYSAGEYPVSALPFHSEAEAIASLEEWEQGDVEKVAVPA